LVAHLQFAQTNRTKLKLQKSYQATAPRQTQQDGRMKREKNGSRQQGFGVMAGEVLRMNIIAKFELWCFVSTVVL